MARVFANPLSNRYKARMLDADTIKPWPDGFDDGYGGGYVQDESSLIMEMAFEKAIARGDNVIIPKIGGGIAVRGRRTASFAELPADHSEQSHGNLYKNGRKAVYLIMRNGGTTMSDWEKNRDWSGAPETEGLRPYSETLPNWNELSDGTKAMLNDIDGIYPFPEERRRAIEEFLAKSQDENK